MKNPPQLQDPFLQQLSEKGTKVSIYLVNGIQLRGTIVGFDQFVILLWGMGTTQLVYKHSVSTVVPQDRFTFSIDAAVGEAATASAARKNAAQLQDPFLRQARGDGAAVAVYLVNSIKLDQQQIKWYDQYVVMLESIDSGAVQMVYKHSISTIVPPRGFELRTNPLASVEPIAA